MVGQYLIRMSHKFEKRCVARQNEIRVGSVLAHVTKRIAAITPPRALVVLRFLLNTTKETDRIWPNPTTPCYLTNYNRSAETGGVFGLITRAVLRSEPPISTAPGQPRPVPCPARISQKTSGLDYKRAQKILNPNTLYDPIVFSVSARYLQSVLVICIYPSKRWDQNRYFHIGEGRFALLFYGALAMGNRLYRSGTQQDKESLKSLFFIE